MTWKQHYNMIEDGSDYSRTFEFDNGTVIEFEVKFTEYEYSDVSYLGEFSNKLHPPSKDAINIAERFGEDEYLNCGYRYYTPMESRDSIIKYFVEKKGWKLHAAKIEAGVQINQNYRRLNAYYNNDWWMMGVIVVMKINGKVVSGDALFGIESDSGRKYFEEVLRQCMRESIRLYKTHFKDHLPSKPEVDAIRHGWKWDGMYVNG